MRLRDILPEIIPQAWQRWIELARSVPPHDPLRLLAYVSHVECAAEADNEAAVAMLGLLDGMLRALIAAGVNRRIVAEGLVGTAVLRLERPHWLVLAGLAAERLRRAIDPGHDRIRLAGETTWADADWDHGETRWDVGIPATDIAVIEGVAVSHVTSSAAAPEPPEPPVVRSRHRKSAAPQSIRERRIEFVCGLCRNGGASARDSYKRVFQVLRDVHGAHHPLLQIGQREQRNCWATVRGRKPWPKPLQSENS